MNRSFFNRGFPALVFSLLAFIPAFSQIEQQKIDSLNKELSKAATDTGRANLSFKLGESYWFNRRMPEAMNYLKQAVALSEKNKYYRHYCNAQLLLGNVYIRLEKFDSALAVLDHALACSQKNNQPEHIPKVHQSLSLLYNHLGDQARAIDYGLKAANGFEQSAIAEINIQSIFAWMEVGNIFEQQQQDDKALEYYQKALDKSMVTNHEWYTKAPKLRVAAIYLKEGRLTDARKIFEEVVALDRKVGGAEPTMEGLSGLGLIAIREKNYPAAIAYFAAAVDTAVNRNFIVAVDGYASRLGHAYFLDKQYDSAYYYYQFALKSATKSGDVQVKKEVYQQMAELEIEKGNLGNAVIYQQRLKSLSDSLYNTERIRTVNNLEILYQTEKKEKQILSLQAVNAERRLAIIKRNRVLLIGGIAAAALVLIFALLYRNSRQKQTISEKEQKLQQEEIKFLNEQQQVISLQSMVNGQEAERTRIAKDLHDGLGGLFSTVKMHLSTLKHEIPSLDTSELFDKSYNLVDTASVEVRRIAHNMMPEVLMKLGLVDALKDMCNNISAGKLLAISLQAYGMEKRLNSSTEIMLYRIIQELLNNIIKHAQATQAIIQFNRDGQRLSVIVEDNGRGFDMQEAGGKNHAGLGTIQSRVNYLKGKLSIESQQGLGTTVMMDFLINEEGML
jgi:two-component system, NarL family, sensor kinase